MAEYRAVRGMQDILPQETPQWQRIEAVARDLFAAYGYEEIRFPIVESAALFNRSIGEVTDIVEKEMYTFSDRSDKQLSLRPEGTAACVRACEEHGLLYNQTQRLWYAGPMFRYERPQKGRQRQFHQIGVEAFGMAGPDIDAEVIALCANFWRELGIEQQVELQLNTLGSTQSRAQYRQQLRDFLQQHADTLDADSQRRLDSNVLRILDSKSPETQAILQDAPALHDVLDDESRRHFESLQEILSALGIDFTVNQRLVRGLDYYCKTAFEWVTDTLGAQGTVCGGGRYDGLVETLGGRPTPGIGFAMGLERLVLMLEQQAPLTRGLHAYFLIPEPSLQTAAQQICEQLRREVPALRLQMHCGGGNFKSQMKKADRSGAQWALIYAADEHAQQQVSVKNLRGENGKQASVALADLANHLRREISNRT